MSSAATLGIPENRLAAAVTPARLARAAREAAAGSEAVLVWSTNLPGWRLPSTLDGVPLLDATTIGTEALLAAAGLMGA